MAGDWIKMEKNTIDKPEVLAMAAALNLDPDLVFAKCFRLWCWADSNSVDGNVTGVTPQLLDLLVHCPGFSQALLDVGWLQVRSGSLVIPRFDRHLGQPAKRRALTSTRVSAHREKKRSCSANGNADGNAPNVTDALPEKRREESKEEPPPPPQEGEKTEEEKKPSRKKKSTDPASVPIPPSLDTPEFRLAWEEWGDFRRQRHSTLTAIGVRKQFKLLAPLGPARAIAVLELSMTNGYTGLFPEKLSNTPAPSTNGHADVARAKADHERTQRFNEEMARREALREKRLRIADAHTEPPPEETPADDSDPF